MIRVPVATSQRTYDVVVGPGLLSGLGRLLGERLRTARCLVVTDANVRRLYLSEVADSLREAGHEVSELTLPAGEREKTLSRAEELYDVLYERGLGRTDAVVALGGGVIGDLSGFVAATYQRGMRLVQCPTTLLAQVDAAVGGKVGVDFRQGKNYVGTFYQPDVVVADVQTLCTLDERDVRNGAAEVIKYGFLAGGELLGGIKAAIDRQGQHEDPREAREVPFDAEQIAACVRVKAEIVGRDEREETGERHLLNLGHTIGHAIEAAGGFCRYTHGEAVALGLRATLHISASMAGFPEADERRGQAVISAAGLPERVEDIDLDEAETLVARDKKAAAGKIPFVLLQAFGAPRRDVEVPGRLVRETMTWLRERHVKDTA